MTNLGLLRVENLSKSFLLHTQGGVRLPVLRGLSLSVGGGECVGLAGASGSGKSTLLRCLHGNYLPDAGSILVFHRGGWVDLTRAAPHEVLDVRRATLGYVSQFLRVIPRVPALRVVAEPLLDLGVDEALANEKAAALLARLQIPERLWSLSPTSFSGGEKQRVNLARSLVVDAPILLLDEPTSALDARGREIVTEIILERRAAGAAIVGVLHDEAAMERICTRRLDLEMGVARG